jgi:hypothetical protein
LRSAAQSLELVAVDTALPATALQEDTFSDYAFFI